MFAARHHFPHHLAPASPGSGPAAVVDLALARAARCDSALLIADCGQPHFPGWQILAAALIAAAFIQAAAGDGPLRLLRAPRPPVVRIVRTVRAKGE